MKDYEIRLFVRVVKRRMKKEDKTASEVLQDYPKLTTDDKNKILEQLI